MIIPSKQTLIITAAQRKQLFLFDPKTACVLQTYSTQSTLSPEAAYFQPAQQFLIPHLNNTYANIWQADTQQPKKFSIGEGQKITSMLIIQNNILTMGSSHGIFYIFQLPSGILIKKLQLHSHNSQIKYIKFIKQQSYLITGTKKQIKLWALKDILLQQQNKAISQKTIHSILQIIGLQVIKNILCIITERTIQFYYSNTFSLFTINKDIKQLNNLTCVCSSKNSLYIGDNFGKIRQISIDAHQKQLQFQQRKGKIQINHKKDIEIQTKDPISSLGYVESLEYLISGNCKGEIKIWYGKILKNSVQLFKSSISLIYTIPRPNKQLKIPQNLKIKSFHKQQLTKLDQPIYFDLKDTNQMHINPQNQLSSDIYLDRMLTYLKDSSQQLEQEIQNVRKENKQLLQANLHYFTMLDQSSGKKQKIRQYK